MADLVFDTTPLSHFCRAGHLRTLEVLTEAHVRLATRAVRDEIRRGVPQYPELQAVIDAPWLQEVPVDGLEEIPALLFYATRLVTGTRNVGEAATLAWAEVHDAIAIVDDDGARQLASERRVRKHGSLWLIIGGVRANTLTMEEASGVVSQLVGLGARLPCTGQTFPAFVEDADRRGLW